MVEAVLEQQKPGLSRKFSRRYATVDGLIQQLISQKGFTHLMARKPIGDDAKQYAAVGAEHYYLEHMLIDEDIRPDSYYVTNQFSVTDALAMAGGETLAVAGGGVAEIKNVNPLVVTTQAKDTATQEVITGNGVICFPEDVVILNYAQRGYVVKIGRFISPQLTEKMQLRYVERFYLQVLSQPIRLHEDKGQEDDKQQDGEALYQRVIELAKENILKFEDSGMWAFYKTRMEKRRGLGEWPAEQDPKESLVYLMSKAIELTQEETAGNIDARIRGLVTGMENAMSQLREYSPEACSAYSTPVNYSHPNGYFLAPAAFVPQIILGMALRDLKERMLSLKEFSKHLLTHGLVEVVLRR